MRKIQINLVQSTHRAYTLLESLLTLFIVSFLTILLSSSVRNVLTGVEEQLFFLKFETMYKTSQQLAISSHRSVVLEFTGSTISNGYDRLRLPATVQVNQRQQIVLDHNGGNSSLAKIEFLTHQKKISYQLYLGSGNYKKTEK
ncbi:type II secretion system protein [Streptococcus sp. 19428wC2_LYSM12]|uniref:competence type IV pilus minor pilin ComGD n=2 Tax=unclassified Streptococcus TaxID=2608887 RepID=UPI0010724A5B|nr:MULTISPECIES: competence type IV pilus minor pilin ComGD [unclassified Streptococcus]MBF0786735.1 type II secretion system protein [Streptococcus sp. 19428wC2_LYSM12]MCQ9211609.1 type II secretion system GspH family protein [Streptococcus sp. B01]TFV06501.1 type II secretion system protein [Streptococcus sp. LYSM12]